VLRESGVDRRGLDARVAARVQRRGQEGAAGGAEKRRFRQLGLYAAYAPRECVTVVRPGVSWGLLVRIQRINGDTAHDR